MAKTERLAGHDDFSPAADLSPDKIGRLMPFRVKKFLLVASLYDYFALEEDGRLQDLLLKTYQQWNLGYVPRFVRVSGGENALETAPGGRPSTWSSPSCGWATWIPLRSAARSRRSTPSCR